MKMPEKAPTANLLFTSELSSKLFEIINDSETNQKLSEIEREYPYWEKFKYKVKGLKYDPEILWKYNYISRLKTFGEIKLNKSPDFTFKYNTPAEILKFLHHFDLNLGGILEGGSIIPTVDKHNYLISSIMEEAIASSQLEGAATTREIAKEMLRSQRRPRDLSEKMILNNYSTIKRVIEVKDQKLSKELILELHSIISSGTLKDPNNEGKFRITDTVNVVDDMTGEVFYTPPSANRVEQLIDDLCNFANTEDEELKFIHPIIKGITLHFLIGYIHPFVDGNGRTARAIFYWYLIKKGYWLVEYMSISKIIIRAPAQYARAYLYTEYDNNDLTYFIEYNLKCMKLALQSLQTYIQKKVADKRNTLHLIRHEDINERQAEILRSLIVDSQQKFSIKEIESKFGVVYQTARTDLLGLVELGYLEEKKIGKKLIFFKSDRFDKKLQSISSHG